MTDSQSLLAEYRQSGSDAAFRELVARFVDLVYSTALRLVEGDMQRAEDVGQRRMFGFLAHACVPRSGNPDSWRNDRFTESSRPASGNKLLAQIAREKNA